MCGCVVLTISELRRAGVCETLLEILFSFWLAWNRLCLVRLCLSLRVCSLLLSNTFLIPTSIFSSLLVWLTHLHHASVLHRASSPNMEPLQTVRCASGSCFKDGTLHCAKCKVTFYCSKTCQKNHWVKHKKHCSAHMPLPEGSFEFLKLNRDTRNKVSCSMFPLRLHLLT
jgi:hypothetical protein